MKKFLLFLALLAVLPLQAFAADLELPAPKREGGIPIFEAIERRASAEGGSFPTLELELSDLSQLLWAASGLSREGKGWTVPLTKGKPPYLKIYVAQKGGTHLYDWEHHKLTEVNKKDIRADAAVQEFAKIAPCTFIFVMDAEILAEFGDNSKMLAGVASGSMSQNIYLAANNLNVGVRYLTSIQHENISKELNLPKENIPICVVIMGKYAF